MALGLRRATNAHHIKDLPDGPAAAERLSLVSAKP